MVAVLLLGATAVLTTGLQGRSQLLLADLPPSPVEPGTSVSGGDVGRVIPAEIVYTQASELSDEDCQMEVAPVGSPVNLIWENAAAHGQTGLRLQNYREVAQSLDGFEGLLPVVIGEYSSSTVDVGVDGVSYVPLGAYEVGETRILGEDPNALLVHAPLLRPPVNGLGVTAASAGAITDLAGGRELVGRDAIDAVRIGVAGLEGYNAEGREKVAQVAEALQDLGFNVNVVAGSSGSRPSSTCRATSWNATNPPRTWCGSPKSGPPSVPRSGWGRVSGRGRSRSSSLPSGAPRSSP
ncbi:MAG TPA: hypothetical protein GX743_08885 [Actinomycetales bacterium]|nr:hypothetical protein [Actinomycetales bacterium]